MDTAEKDIFVCWGSCILKIQESKNKLQQLLPVVRPSSKLGQIVELGKI